MRIAIFDYQVTRTNPIGGCHWRMLAALAREHQFTVFSTHFENPDRENIEWVQVPKIVPRRPAFLMFAMYHVIAPIRYALYRLRKPRFDLIQIVMPIVPFGDIGYSQFSHCAYLKHAWDLSRPTGLRRFLRWLDHRVQSLAEPLAVRHLKHIIVPCRGLARELAGQSKAIKDKIEIISNPVDLERLRKPERFDRDEFRRSIGVRSDDVLLIFTALGHFERKGLPLLLSALEFLNDPKFKLVVVGGEAELVGQFRSRVAETGLSSQVTFTGNLPDVRPYLWAGDAFSFPSLYEAFSLSTLEAAGAGLPLIVTSINGVEELVRDGINSFVVEPNPMSIARGLQRFRALSSSERMQMSQALRNDAARYATETFVEAWRAFYSTVRSRKTALVPSHQVEPQAMNVISTEIK
jgi:glycosyltransferase involved in cell wall biosynthesis